eukprot:SAG11_NODE_6337_length_1333_cov_1.858185_1_plen_51_part_10
MARVTKGEGAIFCAQIFPEEPLHGVLLRDAARACGWGRAALLLDQSHHTPA